MSPSNVGEEYECLVLRVDALGKVFSLVLGEGFVGEKPFTSALRNEATLFSLSFKSGNERDVLGVTFSLIALGRTFFCSLGVTGIWTLTTGLRTFFSFGGFSTVI